jgi:hypothetical protein
MVWWGYLPMRGSIAQVQAVFELVHVVDGLAWWCSVR